jgi:uncharacterized protein YhaN
MFLVELVMQGVRGIREVARVRFRSGFNFVAAGNESGKTSSVDAALRLLFPRDNASAMNSLISRHTPDASRAALVAFADDGAYYRVLEDFSKRAINLSKYNATAKDFSLMQRDWAEIAQFMAGLTAGISEDEYSRLFVLRREDFQGRPASLHAPAVSAKPAAPVKTAPKRGGTAAQEARLAELRAALQKAEQAADADYQVQSAKLNLEDLNKKLIGLEEITARLEDMENQLAPLRGCENLPENLTVLIKEHEQRQSQKMADTDERTADLESLKRQLDEIPRANLRGDKFFLAGAFIGIASVGAGLFLPSLVPEDYFLIGVLVSLLFIAVAWYNGSRKGAQRKIITKEIEKLEAELADLDKSFEQGGSGILECMKATESATTAELEDKVGNYRYFLSLREDILKERERILDGRNPEQLWADYEKTQQEIAELEKPARALAQYNVDTYSLRQDIERIESEMSAGGATFDFSGSEQEFSEGAAAGAPVSEGGSNGFTTELAIASRVGGIEVETLVPAVEAAAQRNLAAVTGGRYVRIEVGQEGNPVVHAQDDSTVNFSELSHGTKQLLYFCLRTGLIEALAGKLRLPLILDDPLGGFDPGRQQAACQILRALGTKTQVILLSSNPALKLPNDAAAELK